MKRLIKKANKDGIDHCLAILDHSNTLSEGMKSSPAQRFMSRRTRTLPSTSKKLLQPKLVEGVREEKRKIRTKRAFHYSRDARDLPPLITGDTVRMQPSNSPGRKPWRWFWLEADKRAISQSFHRGWFCPQTKQTTSAGNP